MTHSAAERWERAQSDPDLTYGPVPIWWWSGDRLDPDRLRWQLHRLYDGGVRAAVVLNLAPAGPLHGCLADDPPFASPAWWRILTAVCAEARRIGFRLWFYDQLGFSGANLQADLVSAEPSFAGWDLRRTSVTGTGALRATAPPGAVPVAAALSTVDDAVGGAGAVTEVAVDASGAGADAGTTAATLTLYHAVRRGFDYCDPAACAALLDQVHGEFERNAGEYFGDVIVGSFQDELPAMPTWSRSFAAEFAERRGYPLTGVRLAALFGGEGDGHARIRYDYQRTRAQLADEAFFVPLQHWHRRHGLLCGYDQQHPARAGEPIGSTELYADYPRVGARYGAPGSDHWGDPKLHSGLSHLHGGSRTWLEGFHSSGWGGTLEETFDWLLPWLRAGVTLYDPHAVYYATRAGWWEWAPPSTCWRQPYWPQYPAFARLVSRLCELLSLGTHECDVAVLHPTATVQAALTVDGRALPAARAAHESYLALNGSASWLREVPGSLAAAGLDHEVVDDAAVADGTVAGGRLRLADETYRTVLLPGCAWLTDDTAGRLADLAAAGGRVVCVGTTPRGALPANGPGWARFSAAIAGRAIETPTVPAERPAEPAARPAPDAGGAGHRAGAGGCGPELAGRLAAEAAVRCDVPTVVRRSGEARLVLLIAHDDRTGTAQPMHGDWVFFDVHSFFDFDRYTRAMREHGYTFRPGDGERVATLSVPAGWGPAQLWDPVAGTRCALDRAVTGDRATVRVPFASGPAAVVVFGAGTPAPPPGPRPGPVLATLPHRWAGTVEPTLDNRWGDVGPGRADPPVQTWRLAHREADPRVAPDELSPDGWTEVVATFGRYGSVAGPCDTAAELAAARWRPAVYSLSRGIPNDPRHHATLGPKGYVPEEFVHLDAVRVGQWVALRTGFRLGGGDDAAGRWLAVGAPGERRITLDGAVLPAAGDGYLTVQPIAVRAGHHELTVAVRSDVAGAVRLWWALTRDPDEVRRPEWLVPTGTPARVGHRFTLPGRPRRAMLQIGTEGAAVIRLNGDRIGRHGGFDPYAQNRAVRVRPFDVTDRLVAGENELVVEFTDPAGAALWVDGVIETDAGRVDVVSAPGWTIGAPRVRREQWLDPRTACLWPRPHPLPDAGWLDDRPRGAVLPVIPYDPVSAGPVSADPGTARTQWFRWVLPPGAERMTVPVRGSARVWLDGVEAPVRAGAVDLTPNVRHALLAVSTVDGSGGAALTGPIGYRLGSGEIELGDWADAGLGSYSGAVRYAHTFRWTDADRPTWLDLGEVRGTAEVRLNGAAVGELLLSPYRLRVDRWLRAGANRLEIVVRNTLAPYLGDTTPTAGVFAGQRRSGLFGPVRLLGAAARPGTTPVPPSEESGPTLRRER
ncbi:hypothetical protein [Actinocatenispora comari]|uniref:Alpha-L-rhamnosidase-like protein n=1 Tax=Actinocatenispora comari TaxID=2807577 RepID=A0A8J4ELN4_9ACTN|nr:hypothetical protein [Actinocatenispora comari]GIL28701.1 hypothetical protein NUM_39550 [Actinocatenispora comari]